MKQELNAWAIGKNSTPQRVNFLNKKKPFLLFFAIASVMMLSANYSIAQNGCNTCALGYPNNNNLPRSAVLFNESEVLRVISPGPTNCGLAPAYIKMWYNDEHAMLLGVRQVRVKVANNVYHTTDFPISTYTAPPLANGTTNPLVGSTVNSGYLSGNDLYFPNDPANSRPVRPALFVTDITYNPSSHAGDWQYGGTAYSPNLIYGSWKGAVRNIDSTKNPVVVTVDPDVNPAQNNWNLGNGEAPPAGTTNQGYGTLVQWSISALGLIPGHTYRVQVMVHDGDQNKAGGDAGELCTTVVMPPAIYPDINVTYVNVHVQGNVSTNDVIPANTAYGASPTLISHPASSTQTIVMNSNGTYDFVADKVGVYVYKVPVCVPGQVAPCPTSLLTITVLCATCTSNNNPNPPVANTDIASTKKNTPVLLKTLSNDWVGNPGGTLNPASVIVTVAALHGTSSINPATGDNTYTPNNGFLGNDTLTYRVCETPSGLCDDAIQIITVSEVPVNNNNTTLAADDHVQTALNTPVSGNAKPNDTDPENNAQIITAQDTTAPGKGRLVLNSDGSFIFTPVTGFSGPVNFPYKTTDNGTPVATAMATIYIVVAPQGPGVPDLTPSIFNDGTTLIRYTTRDNVLRIFNIGNGATTAPVIFTVPKMLPAFLITVNPNEIFMNVFGGTNVSNADWTIVEEANRFVFTSKPGVVILAGGFKDIGLKIQAIGIKNSTGNLFIQIVFGTGGGETPFNNNSDNNTYSTN